MNTLVNQAMQGDAESFIQLMEDQKQAMQKIAFGFFTDAEDVADAMQQTALNAYEHIGGLKNPAFFKTWLLRILINNCRQLYNSKKRMLTDSDLSDTAQAAYFDTYPEDNAFFNLLSLLHKNDRIIFLLYFGEQYTTKEISHMTGIKESTIRSRIRRGKERLRTQIQREELA